MTSQIKAKLLQHFAAKKKADGGFTLIELLVVIIIIGILSAIALPSFLNQANKAKQSEAKTYIGSMNRAQQAYYLENNKFADNNNFGKLGLGIPQVTDTYEYEIHEGGSDGSAQHAAAAVAGGDASVKGYVGGVKVGELANESTTVAVLCEAVKSPVQGGTNPDDAAKAKGALNNPDNDANAMTCKDPTADAGFVSVGS